ncbi:protein of unknown function [Hyphomicrobium sp. MC1]|nr:protein of unknown function [Hyphomicrobium sp. MC1]
MPIVSWLTIINAMWPSMKKDCPYSTGIATQSRHELGVLIWASGPMSTNPIGERVVPKDQGL